MKHGKIIIAAAAITLCTAGLTTACIVVCRRLFEKNYISVSDTNRLS